MRSVSARIAVSTKAIVRIYPQMAQMFTDEEKYLRLSAFICGSKFRPAVPAQAVRNDDQS